jgi:hypothetical protein
VGERVPVWHPVHDDPPGAGWYLVIVRRDSGDYAIEEELWRTHLLGGWWDTESGTDPVVAWAEEP